jgi:hypothetical protein
MPPHKARLPSGLFYCPKLTKRMIEMSEEMKLVKPSVEYLDSVELHGTLLLLEMQLAEH